MEKTEIKHLRVETAAETNDRPQLCAIYFRDLLSLLACSAQGHLRQVSTRLDSIMGSVPPERRLLGTRFHTLRISIVSGSLPLLDQ